MYLWMMLAHVSQQLVYQPRDLHPRRVYPRYQLGDHLRQTLRLGQFLMLFSQIEETFSRQVTCNQVLISMVLNPSLSASYISLWWP